MTIREVFGRMMEDDLESALRLLRPRPSIQRWWLSRRLAAVREQLARERAKG